MKAHIGVDSKSGLVHSVSGTAANVADIPQTHALLHGQEKQAFADAGYPGVEKRVEIASRLFEPSRGMWRPNAARSKRWRKAGSRNSTLRDEKAKAQVRARVEHPFQVVKNLFRHRKVRYRGLSKNTVQLQSLFALANLFLVRRSLLAAAQP
jgi:transposase, IS5 family